MGVSTRASLVPNAGVPGLEPELTRNQNRWAANYTPYPHGVANWPDHCIEAEVRRGGTP